MRHLILGRDLRVAAIGAHPDDIEIGCGGTLLRLIGEERVTAVAWAVLGAGGTRRAEAEAAAGVVLAGVPEVRVELLEHRDGYFPAQYEAVKQAIEGLVPFRPDLVLAPRRDDAHQDHRLLGELAWTAFRDHLVLEYEIPKYDGDLVTPNAYVEISEEVAQAKVDLLMRMFPSQRDRTWFTPDAFRALLRLRGIEARAPSGLAEGFIARKTILA